MHYWSQKRACASFRRQRPYLCPKEKAGRQQKAAGVTARKHRRRSVEWIFQVALGSSILSLGCSQKMFTTKVPRHKAQLNPYTCTFCGVTARMVEIWCFEWYKIIVPSLL